MLWNDNVFLLLIKNQNGTYFNFEQMISNLTSKKCWTFDSFLLIYANCFTAKRKGNFSTTKILTKNYILIRRRGGKYAGKMAFPIWLRMLKNIENNRFDFEGKNAFLCSNNFYLQALTNHGNWIERKFVVIWLSRCETTALQ